MLTVSFQLLNISSASPDVIKTKGQGEHLQEEKRMCQCELF